MSVIAPLPSHETTSRARRGLAYGGAALLALTLALAAPAPAAPPSEAAPRAGEPVLRIVTAAGTHHLGLADLEAVGLREIRTRTFWPADDGAYQGPLLADVLKRVGLEKAPAIRVTALDGFSQIIPREDWTRWPLMLATRRDGRTLSTRDKGPLRLIYPRDLDPALEDSLYRLRWVWLVHAIEPVHGH